MKCMLISVIERDIYTEIFDSVETAIKALKDEFCEAIELEEYDFTESFDTGDCGFDIDELCAYVSEGNNFDNYDWRIVVI